MKFRYLRADEVECRVSTVTEKGCSLLLYKDARCDMNILDEEIGSMNWKREHTRDNANCIVSIWDPEKGQWISKEDTGTESNTEKEKGLASDSFKRACFNWGIGRGLYTAPFIWIPASDLVLFDKNGKKSTNDRFEVTDMEVQDGKIVYLVIKNKRTSKTYSYGNKTNQGEDKPRDSSLITAEQIGKMKIEMLRTGATEDYICKYYKVQSINDMTQDQWSNAMAMFKKTPDRKQK